MTTLWVQVPNPKLDEGAGTSAWLADRLWWYMAGAAVLGLIIAGARMAWNARAGMQTLQGAVQSLLILSLVSGGGIAVVNVALQAGDGYSRWILSGAGGDGFGERLLKMLTVLTAVGPIGTILVIVLGLVAVISGIVQLVLLIVRSASLVILVGLWPLSASATHTSWGQQWFKKITGWIVAMVLYKPAAATIYAAALHMFGEEQGLLGALMGMTAMVLALAALPALMKLCVPLVGGLSDGAASGGGALVAGAAVGAGSLSGSGGGPTGAAPVPPMWGSSAAGGGLGSSTRGPSGAGPTPGDSTTGFGGGKSPAGGGAGGGGSQPTGAGKELAGAGVGGGAGSKAAAVGGGPAGAAAVAGAQLAGAAASGARRMANDGVGGPQGSAADDGNGGGPSGASGAGRDDYRGER